MRDQATGRARGFAFVEMVNDEDAQKAIQQFHQYQYDGRALVVNEARPKESGGFGGGGGMAAVAAAVAAVAAMVGELAVATAAVVSGGNNRREPRLVPKATAVQGSRHSHSPELLSLRTLNRESLPQ